MAIKPEELNIFIAIPCYGQMMSVPFVTSVFALSQRLASLRIRHEIKIIGDSLIPRLRNTFAGAFLDTECTHMLFLDCDLQFTPDSVLHCIDMEKDIIGVAYTRKDINWENIKRAALQDMPADKLPEVMGNLVANLDEEITADANAPIPVSHVGTGILLLTRNVFEKMKSPELEYECPENDPTYKEGKIMWDFFGCFISKTREGTNQLLSEDYAFCERAKVIGIQSWMLTCHRTVHYGIHGFVFNMPALSAMQLQPEVMKKDRSNNA